MLSFGDRPAYPLCFMVLEVCTLTTLYNVCAVAWGVQYRGGYHEYRGGVQYRGGYHDKCGGILSTMGVFSTVGVIMSTMGVILSTVGDIMMHVGDIMSTVEGVQYRGGYHPLKFEYRGGYHDTCGDIMSTVGYSNNKRFSPHGTEHPPQYS